ncbi:MAG TPA: LytR C-terminal domain-containing protein [Pseudonocardia sp.]
MTEPAPSGGPSPLRVGGLALVGAGAVAALIGLATLLPGGGGGTAAATPTTAPAASATAAPTSAPAVVPTSVEAAPNAQVPVPSFPASPTNAVAAPDGTAPGPAGTGNTGTGADSAAAAGGRAAATGQAPVRVYNNSTITGLAARAANDFRADGWQIKAVSNYPSGIISTSTVYYRPGTSEQTAASSLGSQFGLRVAPRFTGIDDATPGLIVIVTNDYQKR